MNDSSVNIKIYKTSYGLNNLTRANLTKELDIPKHQYTNVNRNFFYVYIFFYMYIT